MASFFQLLSYHNVYPNSLTRFPGSSIQQTCAQQQSCPVYPWAQLSLTQTFSRPTADKERGCGPQALSAEPCSSEKQEKSSTPAGPTLLGGQLRRHEPEQLLLPTKQSWTPISRRLSLPLSNFRTRPGGKKSCLFCAADYSQAHFLTTPTHTRTE